MMKHSKGFMDEFKAFALQGNILDLAVGIVIGTAFNAIVTSLVNDIIMQAVAWAFGKPNFLTAIVNFLIIALSVFVTIKFLMKWMPKKEALTE